MSFKVKIKNFQKIKNAELSFDPGLTVIVGATNNGKTSILRAIEATLFNKSVDSSISYGSDFSEVAVSYNKNLLVWERNKTKASKTSYKLNNNMMVKVGRGQLDEVRDAFNIREISLLRTREKLNFWKQMRFPFLLDRTPAQLFEFIVMSSEETNLSQVLKLMNSDMKNMSGAVLVAESLIDEYKNKISKEADNLKKFKNCPEIIEEIINEESLVKSLLELETLCNKHEEIGLEVKTHKSRLSRIDEGSDVILKLISELDESFAKINFLERNIKDWERTLDEKNGFCDRQKNIDNEIGKLGKVSKKDIDSYLVSERSIKELSDLLFDYGTLKGSFEEVTKDLIETTKEIESVNSELIEFRVCPLCGQTIK